MTPTRSRWWLNPVAALALLGLPNAMSGQFCATASNQGTIVPTGVVQTVVGAAGDHRYWTFATTAGCTYTFTTCGIATNDTYLRLYSTATGGTVLASSDDFCSAQSQISFVETSTTTRSILLNNWSCNPLSANTSMNYSVSCALAPMCDVATDMGTIVPGPVAQTTPAAAGVRRYWTFNATAGTLYNFNTCGLFSQDMYLRLYDGNGGGALLASSDDICNGVQPDLNWVAPSNGIRTILLTDYFCNVISAGGSLSYTGGGFNPCSSPVALAACGSPNSFSVASGDGAYNPPSTSCGFTTPGKETIFTYVAPTTGSYLLQQTSSFGYVDYFLKTQSAGCSGSGWTCIGDINGAGSWPVSLAAGTAYYIMADPEDNTGGAINFTLQCPAPLANDDCSNAIVINCASTPVSGTTIGASVDAIFVDCGAGGTNTTEQGVWYKIIGDDNQYTITSCDPGFAGYDTRLTVYTGSCGVFTCVTGNDDMSPSCATGSFRSRVQFNANSGSDYYVLVHGYQFGTGLSATGAFNLHITCAPLCTPLPGNDLCGSATTITVDDPAISDDNFCAGATAGNPSCESAFATLPDV